MIEKKYKKLGVVVEGGAMRGIFASGFLDSFLEANYNPFHTAVGVSAGSTTLASYLSKATYRNYKIITTYSLSKDFIHFPRALKGGHIMDLDWLWQITLDELPIDNNLIANGPTNYWIGLTCAKSGKPIYIKPKSDQVNDVAMASSALPILYKHPVVIDNHPYYDGGVSTPIPYDKAVEEGCDHIIVIRSRKKDYKMAPPSKKRLLRYLLKKYPNVAKATENRWLVYNDSIDTIRRKNPNIRVDEINPPDSFSTERLTKDIDILNHDYALGKEEGKRILSELQSMQYENLWASN